MPIQMPKQATLCLALCGALMLAATPAMAKNDKHDDDHGRGNQHHAREDRHDDHDDHYRGHDDNSVIIAIAPQDRVVINQYIVNDYRKHCPPGLEKKHNGCTPPGHAKRWSRGETLPDYVVWQPLPQPVLVQLRPAPTGTQYVRVDKDVYLVSEASKKILDAVVLLSAVD